MVNIGGGGGPSSTGGMNIAGGNDESAAFGDTANAGGGQDNGMDGKSDEQGGRGQRSPYTMPGVLHFIQHEWSKFEMDRSQWEMERAEMQARISFLQGERKGQENLKLDLVRRIKMLEFSLKQERAKNYRLTHNGQEPDADMQYAEDNPDNDLQVPLEIDAVNPSQHPNSHTSWRQGRQLLRQYLQEIGYSEQILDVRSFRVKNLLGLLPQQQSDWQFNDNNDKITLPNCSDSDDEPDSHMRGGDKELDVETEQALDEFSFLSDDKATNRSAAGGGRKKERKSSEGDDWMVNAKGNRSYRLEQEKKRGDHSVTTGPGSYGKSHGEASKSALMDTNYDTAGFFEVGAGNAGKKTNFMDINAVLGLPDDGGPVDIKDDAMPEDDAISSTVRWQLRQTLRSHWDSVRAMQFHPVEPVMVTAGEDGTAKLWNLAAAVNPGSSTGKGEPKGQTSSSSTTELEPVYTFRGHSGPILSMDMATTGDQCYTGGKDGIICCWTVPSINIDVYDKYDNKILVEKLRGHTDAIWSIVFHTSDNRLVSASADGTLKLWEPGVSEPLLKTYGSPTPNLRPTSVDFVSTEPQQLLAAYTSSHACILDLETGKSVLTFDYKDESDGPNPVGRITKILSHPTMPVTLTAGDDRKIRYFDNNTGKLIQAVMAHVDGVSSLAIDPNGLYLLSGSHDGSLRLWNMEKRVCLQEIAAHRKKFDMSVLTVAFHPSRPLIGSGGADGLAKVFGSQQRSGTGTGIVEDW